MPRKSIYRQPDARTYQLVHRSQRDPLIHDPDASQHVLKEFERENIKKGKTRADLENSLSPDEIDKAESAGQSALYGIYYDDSEYDYTQHLRSVGVQEKGVDSVLIEVASSARPKQKSKEKDFNFIPKEALPSNVEIPHHRMLEAQEAIPSELHGFQPEMNPHLRQTLEALDDDAFIQEDVDDGFFAGLMEGGERDDDQEELFDFEEDGADTDIHHLPKDSECISDEEDGQDWHVRFAKFKKEQRVRIGAGSVLDGASEGGDTLGRLPSLSVLGAKKRKRKGTSDASGYSMSSSSMFRNEGLTSLDEQFERFEKEYASDGSLDDDELENASDISADSEPPLLNPREDFDAVMDEFLRLELVGNKLAPSLEGDTPTDKLNAIRKTLVAGDDAARRRALLDRVYVDDTKVPIPVDVDAEKERWDCETILTTYSNLENHPRLLRLKQKPSTKKIVLDGKTGLPSIIENATPTPVLQTHEDDSEEDDDRPVRVTVARPKGELREDKKARKKAVKEERQQRRIEKKGNKETFALERKNIGRVMTTREKAGVRKL